MVWLDALVHPAAREYDDSSGGGGAVTKSAAQGGARCATIARVCWSVGVSGPGRRGTGHPIAVNRDAGTRDRCRRRHRIQRVKHGKLPRGS